VSLLSVFHKTSSLDLGATLVFDICKDLISKYSDVHRFWWPYTWEGGIASPTTVHKPIF
jgi:hypothetical protein